MVERKAVMKSATNCTPKTDLLLKEHTPTQHTPQCSPERTPVQTLKLHNIFWLGLPTVPSMRQTPRISSPEIQSLSYSEIV